MIAIIDRYHIVPTTDARRYDRYGKTRITTVSVALPPNVLLKHINRWHARLVGRHGRHQRYKK